MSAASRLKTKGRTGIQELNLGVINDDAELQPRKTMDLETLREYSAAWAEGADFPPITVFFDGETYWLADGFFRVRSARKALLTDIKATVYDGDKRDAKLFSLGANATHGLKRTNEDKKNAVLRMLDDAEWCLWTDTEIARACAVSHGIVARIREGSPGVKGHGVAARIGGDGEIHSTTRRTPDRVVEGVDPKTFKRPPTIMNKAEVADKFVRKIASHLKKSDPETRVNVPYAFGACEIATSDHLYNFVVVSCPKDIYIAVGKMMMARACINPAARITIIGHFPQSVGEMIRVLDEGMGISCQTPEQVLAKR